MQVAKKMRQDTILLSGYPRTPTVPEATLGNHETPKPTALTPTSASDHAATRWGDSARSAKRAQRLGTRVRAACMIVVAVIQQFLLAGARLHKYTALTACFAACLPCPQIWMERLQNQCALNTRRVIWCASTPLRANTGGVIKFPATGIRARSRYTVTAIASTARHS